MDDDTLGERLAQLRGKLQALQVQLEAGHKLHAELQQCIDLVEGGWGESQLADYYAWGGFEYRDRSSTARECRFDRKGWYPPDYWIAYEEKRAC